MTRDVTARSGNPAGQPLDAWMRGRDTWSSLDVLDREDDKDAHAATRLQRSRRLQDCTQRLNCVTLRIRHARVVADGFRVNAVSPGVITTPFHERYSTAEQLKTMQATIPMNRLGTPDECAGTFVYLAPDVMSGYVTGQVIEVNGGQLMP